jgi:hypothetical protein
MRATAITAKVTGYPLAGYELDRAAAYAATAAHAAKTATMLVAAPFIGLAFVVALPFMGLGVAAWLAARALWTHYRAALIAARNVALFFAAPFIGLVYAVAFPFVGTAALVWMGVRAAVKRPAA